jgi:hypothetical protein
MTPSRACPALTLNVADLRNFVQPFIVPTQALARRVQQALQTRLAARRGTLAPEQPVLWLSLKVFQQISLRQAE